MRKLRLFFLLTIIIFVCGCSQKTVSFHAFSSSPQNGKEAGNQTHIIAAEGVFYTDYSNTGIYCDTQAKTKQIAAGRFFDLQTAGGYLYAVEMTRGDSINAKRVLRRIDPDSGKVKSVLKNVNTYCVLSDGSILFSRENKLFYLSPKTHATKLLASEDAHFRFQRNEEIVIIQKTDRLFTFTPKQGIREMIFTVSGKNDMELVDCCLQKDQAVLIFSSSMEGTTYVFLMDTGSLGKETELAPEQLIPLSMTTKEEARFYALTAEEAEKISNLPYAFDLVFLSENCFLAIFPQSYAEMEASVERLELFPGTMIVYMLNRAMRIIRYG